MVRRGENIYKRKDGRWEGRYKKGRKEDGRIVYGYIYGRSYQSVKDSLSLYKSKYNNSKEITEELSINVKEWMYHWLSQNKKFIKESTYSGYKYKIDKYIIPAIGHFEMNKLTIHDLENMIEIWQESGLSSSSIRVVFTILRSSFLFGVKKKYLNENICDHVDLPSEKRNKVRSLTIPEQKMLENEARKSIDGLGFAVIFSLRTGLRIGELAALKWEDIDMEGNYIYVSHTVQRIPKHNGTSKTKIIYSTTKTQTSIRKIPMSDDIKKWLLKRNNTSTPYIFSNNETPCEPRLITYHFHKIRERAGLNNIHFHQLRHTFATRCLESSADIASVSSLLGHSSIKMTLDIYADTMMENRIKAIKNMEMIVKTAL
ncbi:tyrosine-type recombinase/integrase [Enterococcus sp. AZ196]|uniref:tyrosine-type recombinase/integrase n=1 Tax=Enterococcus sp. AZ196 TaxID=2774659 RepID=UPI003D295A43